MVIRDLCFTQHKRIANTNLVLQNPVEEPAYHGTIKESKARDIDSIFATLNLMIGDLLASMCLLAFYLLQIDSLSIEPNVKPM